MAVSFPIAYLAEDGYRSCKQGGPIFEYRDASSIVPRYEHNPEEQFFDDNDVKNEEEHYALSAKLRTKRPHHERSRGDSSASVAEDGFAYHDTNDPYSQLVAGMTRMELDTSRISGDPTIKHEKFDKST